MGSRLTGAVTVAGVDVGFIAIYHDLSERLRAEEALREQKQYLEAVVQNSPVAIVTIDQRADVAIALATK